MSDTPDTPTQDQYLQYLHDLTEWYKDEVQRVTGILLGDEQPAQLDSGPNNPPPPPPELQMPLDGNG